MLLKMQVFIILHSLKFIFWWTQSWNFELQQQHVPQWPVQTYVHLMFTNALLFLRWTGLMLKTGCCISQQSWHVEWWMDTECVSGQWLSLLGLKRRKTQTQSYPLRRTWTGLRAALRWTQCSAESSLKHWGASGAGLTLKMFSCSHLWTKRMWILWR